MVAKFVDMLISYGMLDAPCREQYIYALTLSMEQMITYSILILIALFFKRFFWEWCMLYHLLCFAGLLVDSMQELLQVA